jgi:hypothetical protein
MNPNLDAFFSTKRHLPTFEQSTELTPKSGNPERGRFDFLMGFCLNYAVYALLGISFFAWLVLPGSMAPCGAAPGDSCTFDSPILFYIPALLLAGIGSLLLALLRGRWKLIAVSIVFLASGLRAADAYLAVTTETVNGQPATYDHFHEVYVDRPTIGGLISLYSAGAAMWICAAAACYAWRVGRAGWVAKRIGEEDSVFPSWQLKREVCACWGWALVFVATALGTGWQSRLVAFELGTLIMITFGRLPADFWSAESRSVRGWWSAGILLPAAVPLLVEILR